MSLSECVIPALPQGEVSAQNTLSLGRTEVLDSGPAIKVRKVLRPGSPESRILSGLGVSAREALPSPLRGPF